MPPVVRFVRAYGAENETLPPILVVKQRSPSIVPVFGESFITIEIDIQASVPPALSATVVHCTADWKEDGNIFLNDIGFMRTSNIAWTSAPPSSRYYTFRAKVRIPDDNIKIPYGGNWKVRFTELGNDNVIYAEARFFAIDCAADCTLDIIGDLYEPTKKVSPAALTIEASVFNNQLLSDLQLHSAVFYRMNRWNEPMSASQSSSLNFGIRNRFNTQSRIAGMTTTAKRFRIESIPAENEYRVLDMTNIAMYPALSTPIRIPFSDLRRNGSILFKADDAAMITKGIYASNDEYVPVEFVLDPENRFPSEDIFLIGSFNNWKTSSEWQMQFVESERLYKLRHWIRRARHNYSYCTGEINADNYVVEKLSYEEFEGNNTGAGHTFIAFVYYRDPSFGGYDSIVAVAAASVFGQLRR